MAYLSVQARAVWPRSEYFEPLASLGRQLARFLNHPGYRIISEDRNTDPRFNLFVHVALITVFGNVAIVANPGFFSHDEWEIHDYVATNGLIPFIRTYGRVYAGAEFGTPVRPIGFIQEGLLSGWMDNAPFVPHAFSVLLQTLIALIFAKVLFAAGFGRRRSLVAAVLVGLSPLTTFATGWTAACFDQWYPLFALLAAGAVTSMNQRGFNAARIGVLVAAGAAAILSKETAIILPVAAAIVWVLLDVGRGVKVRWSRVVLTSVLAGLPVLAYLAIRIPGIIGSMHSKNGPYSPALALIPRNVVAYFTYPFLTNEAEMVGFLNLPDTTIIAAFAVHAVLLIALVWRFGWKRGGLYVAGYFCFLLPIITLPGLQSHYMFASAFAMSIGLACILVENGGSVRIRATSILGLALAYALTQHGFNIQAKLYIDGQCQRAFLTTLDARLADPARPAEIAIKPTPAARWWVAVRAVYDRKAYAHVHMSDGASGAPSDFIMDDACRVVSAKPI